MSNKNELDQYYTNIDKVKDIIGPLPNDCFYVEPSAGSGNFIKLLNNRNYVMFDLEPKLEGIIKLDFLKEDISNYLPEDSKIITIGNPPFGKNSSLAIKFFNKACEFSDEIRFIVPKTFRKVSIHNKLNLNFHLVIDKDLPKNSFLLDGKSYDVPCCYQVWKKYNKKRIKVNLPIESSFFEFVEKGDNPDASVRRAGSKAGFLLEGTEHSESSTYFIKVFNPIFFRVVNSSCYKDIIKEVRDNTAGVRSVSKGELVNCFNKAKSTLESLQIL